MQWFGKGIGGLIGAVVAGPVGSLIGVLLGHQWDTSIAGRRRGHGSARAISRLFFEVTFEAMGQIAKVDGRVSEDEVRVAHAIMDLCREPDAMTHPDGMQIKVSRQELSRLVGCSREMAGRVLKVLEDQGLVRASGKTIVVFNARRELPKARPEALRRPA